MSVSCNIVIVVVLIGVKLRSRNDNNPNEIKVTTTKPQKLTNKEYIIDLDGGVDIDDLSIGLLNIEDSRCPKNVECYWPGELSYDVLINGDSYQMSTVNKPKLEYKNYVFNIVANKCNENEIVLKIERK